MVSTRQIINTPDRSRGLQQVAEFCESADGLIFAGANISNYRKVCYSGATALFRDLAMALAAGSLRNLLLRLSRNDVLVVDDWAMSPLSETERRDFWESANTVTRRAQRF